MTIKFKDTEFSVSENNLALLNASAPILVMHRKLTSEYTSDIDLSRLQEYQKRIGRLELAIKQLKEKKEITKEDEELIEKYTIDLETINKDLEQDTEVKSLIDLKNNIEAIILTEIASDTIIMFRFFKKILKGDVSKIDVSDTQEFIKFSSEVLAFFFSIMAKNRKE